MNFVGKFDAKLHVDGSGVHPEAHLHADSDSAHAPSDAIIVPDANLLFNGDFKQSGLDLILSRDDHEWVVQNYFKGEKRAALASPDGARLAGDIVNALAGHVEVAQADGNAGAGKVIGHVTKLTGTATAIRNGVSIILNQGDNVEKGDVVQSGSGSTLGVTFIDGTVFGLSSNARMVLNEMVYDPNGSDNSSLISLVAGTISFVAGQTAKHGDMKIDTPVATMGIRGTAVLVEIDFDVPGQNGTPEAKFQVLVEPDGTTGSYILFDKNTLAPIAIVDKAGQQVHVSNNNVSFSDSPLSPELQKLITDVFTLKFTDNTNPQTLTHFTDTLIPEILPPIKLPNGPTVTPVILLVTPAAPIGEPSPSTPPSHAVHINQPPVVITQDSSFTERAGVTGSSAIDTTSGTISFADINVGDQPTVKATFSSFAYQNAQHQDITLNAQELADIQALEVPLLVVQAPGNTYNGLATWTYTIPDKAFDFLGAGETLTLTYMAEVDSNYAPDDLATRVPFTITITGTNDAPVITTGAENIRFVGGKTTQGGVLTTSDSTAGTLAFTDPDLTDTHTVVSTNLTSASLLLGGQTLDKAALDQDFPDAMKAFESALSASIATDSTGTGAGTISWQLAKLSAFLADIVPNNETLVLDYTVEIEDSQGAIATRTIEVQITGNNTPAVVWIETVEKGSSKPGDWNDGSNWETGLVPTANDDAFIITDQLIGQTPVYPVTIKSVADGGIAASANSLTMNDFADTLSTVAPELDNYNILTVGDGGLSLSADSILKNFGTLSVGSIASLLGKAEISGQSDLENSGLIKLYQGGDFTESRTITNSGTIEVVGGMLNVEVAVANSGGNIEVDGTATLTLNDATITSGTVTDNGTLDSTGASAIDDAAITNTNLIESTGGVLTIDPLAPILTLTNSGTLEASGGDLDITGEPVNNTGTLQAIGGGTLKLTATTVTNTGAGTVTVGAGSTLDLVGASSSVNIDGGTVGNSGTIDNVSGSNTISADITNTGAGTVTVASGSTLTLANGSITGGTVTDNGTIGITGASTLAGVTFEGATDGTDTIDNAGILRLGSGGLTLGGSEGFKLALDGTGTLALNGQAIKATTAGMTLENDGNTISGDGHVGLGDDLLTLHNELAGTIDANVGGQMISIDTVATVNAGTIEATLGGEVSFVGGDITNSNALTASGGGKLAFTNETIANTGTLHLDGSESASQIIIHGTLTLDGGDGSGTGPGQVTLTGGSQILSDLSPATLVNVDNTISGSGSIGDFDLTMQNEKYGVIDATGILALNAVATTNAGTLEATGTGTLRIEGSVSNSGLIEANGGTVYVASTASISGTPTVIITDGGVAEFAGGSTAQPLDLNATFSGTGTLVFDNSQHYGGAITGFGVGDTIDLTDLTYSTSETDVWNSGTHTLTITSVSDGVTSTTSLNLGDTTGYTQNSFALENDGHCHTEVVLSPAQASLGGLDSAGNAVDGYAVTASLTDAHASGPATYTWLENGQIVQSGINPSFTPGVADIGKALDVVIGFTDGGHSEQVTALAGIVAVPPAVSVTSGAVSTTENAPLTLNGLNVSFADAGIDNVTVTLDVDDGRLALAPNMSGVTGSGTGTVGSPLILTGTLAAIDTALGSGVVYTPNSEFAGIDTLSVSARDGAFSSNTATLSVVVASPIMATINFDDASAGTSGTALSDYFANYGVTLSAAGSGAVPIIEDDRLIYGGGVVNATTGHNLLGESGGFPVSYTVTFAHALTSFAFDRVQEDAGGSDGSSYPEWTATAYDASGNVLSTVSEGETLVLGSPVLAAHYVLTGNDIAYVTFSGNDQGHDGFADVLTDSWVLTDALAAAPAATLVWNESSGDWATSTQDWSTNAVPTSADDAALNAASALPYTVTIANGESASANTLHLHSAEATIDDHGSLNLAGNLVIDHGVFDLDNGSLQALSIQVASTGSFQGSGTVSGPLSVSGIVEATGTLDFANYVTGTGAFKIGLGATLEFDGPVSNGTTVAFAGSTGTLDLTQPSTFTGEIAGISHAGDVLDIHGFTKGTTAVTGSGSYDIGSNITTLTVADSSDGLTETFKLVGDLSNSTWTVTPDGNGGVDIVDPPAAANPPATSTIVASGPNQIMTGNAASDTFAFNFTGVGHATVTDFHPTSDALQFASELFANVQAALNATHDDGHGNTVIALDVHDTITLNGILKAQLQASDFHFV